MFLKVEAGEITMVLNLGTDMARASDVIEMFENNAKFIKTTYNTVQLEKSKQTIELGSSIEFHKSSYNDEVTNIVISSESEAVGFVIEENNAFCDVDKIKAEYLAKIQTLKKEIEQLNAKNKSLEFQLDEATKAED